MLTKETVQQALDTIKGTMFTIDFLTVAGEPRTYNGRLNTKKGLKDNERSAIVRKAFEANGVVPIKLTDGVSYKAFKLDRVMSIRGAGQEWT
jgi:hypothetical protein